MKRLNIMKVVMICGVFILASTGLLNAQEPDYEFSVSPCKAWTAMHPVSQYIESARWDGEILEVKLILTRNCSIEEFSGDVLLSGDQLTFTVEGTFSGEFLARCNCDSLAIFRIKEIEKKEYSIVFKTPRLTDRMLLRVDNSVSDYCDGDPKYQCYAEKYKTDLGIIDSKSERIVKKGKIHFENEDLETIAAQYPKFVEYLNKEKVNFGLYNAYQIGFDEKAGDILIRGYNVTPEYGMLTGLPGGEGATFEQAVRNYIASIDARYGPQSMYVKLKNKLELPITYLSPGKNTIRFLHREESIYYHDDIKFEDRPENWSFEFDSEAKSADLVSRKELLDLLDLAEKAYEILKKDGRFEEQWIRCEINREGDKAVFSAQAVHEIKIVEIHNREVEIPIQDSKKFYLDFNKKEVTSSNPLQ